LFPQLLDCEPIETLKILQVEFLREQLLMLYTSHVSRKHGRSIGAVSLADTKTTKTSSFTFDTAMCKMYNKFFSHGGTVNFCVTVSPDLSATVARQCFCVVNWRNKHPSPIICILSLERLVKIFYHCSQILSVKILELSSIVSDKLIDCPVFRGTLSAIVSFAIIFASCFGDSTCTTVIRNIESLPVMGQHPIIHLHWCVEVFSEQMCLKFVDVLEVQLASMTGKMLRLLMVQERYQISWI
jgi:hypothetical protein